MLAGIIASQRPVTVVGPGGALFLDLYPTGIFTAHSAARKLRVAYSGPCMRVRRSSDSAEQDIGFDGSDNLDEASLLSFTGSNDAFVIRLYDQTPGSSGKDFIQTNTSRQPQIVVSGVIQRIGVSPAMLFAGAQSLYLETGSAQGGSSTTLLLAFRNTGNVVSVVYETGDKFWSKIPGIMVNMDENAPGELVFAGSGSISNFSGWRSSARTNPQTIVFKGSFDTTGVDQGLTFPAMSINGTTDKAIPIGSSTVGTAVFSNPFSINLGCRDATSPSYQFSGLIGEVVRYSGLTYATDASIDANLISKFS